MTSTAHRTSTVSAGIGPPSVSLVIPCRNEAMTVAACVTAAIRGLAALSLPGEVIVVDNASHDASAHNALLAGARIIVEHQVGYGAAIRAGVAGARGQYVVIGDADGSYDFTVIGAFILQLQQGMDLVVGNRFTGGIQPGAMPFLNRRLGNPALSLIGRTMFHVPIHDFHCGLRAFRASSIRSLELNASGMEYASEMIAKAALANLTVSEIPVELRKHGRPTSSTHLRPWRDAVRHLKLLTAIRIGATRRPKAQG